MTTHNYPDGTVATHPSVLDSRPDVADQLDSVVERATIRLDSPASFIPAVHDPRLTESLSELLAWRDVDRQHGTDDDEGHDALLRLRDVADRLGAA